MRLGCVALGGIIGFIAGGVWALLNLSSDALRIRDVKKSDLVQTSIAEGKAMAKRIRDGNVEHSAPTSGKTSR